MGTKVETKVHKNKKSRLTRVSTRKQVLRSQKNYIARMG
uniref:Uncharacterized protein n=1 Tax=Arundo donax TaxID=35708 RepID=A0A0A8ZCU1_ARUDO